MASSVDEEMDRAIDAMVAVMSPPLGPVDALDVCRNAAYALREALPGETAEDVMRQMLRDRRKNWPGGTAWARLSDTDIATLARKSAAAWESVMSGELKQNPAQISSIAKAVAAAPNFEAKYGLKGAITRKNVLGEGQFAVAVASPSHPDVVVKFTVDPEDAALAKRVMDLGVTPGLVEVKEVVAFRVPVRGKERHVGIVEAVGKPKELAKYEAAPLYGIVLERLLTGRDMPADVLYSGGLSRFSLWTSFREAGLEKHREELRERAPEHRALFEALVAGYQTLLGMGYELRDIRDENLGWSPTRQQVVLFDFGLVHGRHVALEREARTLPVAKNPPSVTAETARAVRAKLGVLVPLEALRAGIEVELEHTDDPFVAGKIALDHLKEFPDYYERLAIMEDRAKKGLAPNHAVRPGMVLTLRRRTVYAERGAAEREVTRTVERIVAESEGVVSVRFVEVPERVFRVDLEAGEVTSSAKPPLRYEILEVSDEGVTRNPGKGLSRTRVAFDRCFDEVANRFPDFGDVELHQDEKAGADNGRGAERQFGYCEDGKPIRIAFAAKIEKLPEANIAGLVAHEFGHAIDYRYGKRELERVFGRRLPDGVEKRADAIAEAVFGKTIKYDAKDVQCVSCRGESPRPRRLGA